MTDSEYKIETATRLARIETKLDHILMRVDEKADKTAVALNRKLIFLCITASFALISSVIAGIM